MLLEIKSMLIFAAPVVVSAGLYRVLNTLARGRRDLSLAREHRVRLESTLAGLPPGAAISERSPDGFERTIWLPSPTSDVDRYKPPGGES
jgi:hypothetical protein